MFSTKRSARPISRDHLSPNNLRNTHSHPLRQGMVLYGGFKSDPAFTLEVVVDAIFSNNVAWYIYWAFKVYEEQSDGVFFIKYINQLRKHIFHKACYTFETGQQCVAWRKWSTARPVLKWRFWKILLFAEMTVSCAVVTTYWNVYL